MRLCKRSGLGAMLVLVGLAAPAAAGKVGGQFSEPAIVDAAKQLAEVLGMPIDRRDVVLGRLEELLKEEGGLAKRYGERSEVRGIFAYQIGEGGLIVKVKQGKGRLRYAGGKAERDLQLKAVTVGAQIGGSSEWGFGLVLGLTDDADFGGKYSGRSFGATAGTASTTITELAKKGVTDEAHFHRVVLVGTAAGLSADAAGAQLTIKVKP